MLCSCINPIFEKIFVPEIWAKMFAANQITGFFNQPYLQNESIKQPVFLHVDTNSHELKVDQNFLGGHGHKWAWPVWSWDSEISCISRITRWNELIFCMLVQIQESLSYFNDFLVGMVRDGRGHLVHETLKSAVSKE